MSDEIERRPAGENPWYVLMTIAGEQGEEFDEALHARNRRFWHGWIGAVVDLAVRDAHCERVGIEQAEFFPFNREKMAEWEAVIAARVTGELPGPGDVVDLGKTHFEKMFRADRMLFPGFADFQSAAFSGGAYFESAAFSGDVFFGRAEFSGDAFFVSAAFAGYAFFGSAAFSGDAIFGRAVFSGYAFFGRAAFENSLLFQNADFKSSISFEGVTFKAAPPQFYEADLHEDTNWAGMTWPPVPSDKSEAYNHRRAYERLRLMMDQQKKFEDEQFFLIKGFQCKEVEDGPMGSLVSRAYGLISGYGTSLVRPALGLLVVWMLGWLLLGLGFLFEGSCPADMVGGTGTGCMWSSLQVSLANTFPFLGAGRSILEQEIEELIAFDWYEWLAMSQTVLGPIFLFFLLMGMRNRFRMR